MHQDAQESLLAMLDVADRGLARPLNRDDASLSRVFGVALKETCSCCLQCSCSNVIIILLQITFNVATVKCGGCKHNYGKDGPLEEEVGVSVAIGGGDMRLSSLLRAHLGVSESLAGYRCRFWFAH